MNTELIEKGNLETTLATILKKEQVMADALEKGIAELPAGEIRDGMTKQLNERREVIVALEAGHVPVTVDGLVRTSVKSGWRAKEIKALIKNMPQTVRDAWEDAKSLGIFKSFAISAGDPVLVGRAGRKTFLIGTWLNVEGGASIGYCFRPKRG